MLASGVTKAGVKSDFMAFGIVLVALGDLNFVYLFGLLFNYSYIRS
jgi:hypothetical protein